MKRHLIRSAAIACIAFSLFADAASGQSSLRSARRASHLETSGTDSVRYGESGVAHGCDSCGDFSACGCSSASFLLDWSRVDLWLGTTSFTGQGNFVGGNNAPAGQVGGQFGFQEGFNFGSRLPSLLGGQVGSQLGLRAVQTSLDGSTVGSDRRSQLFLTTGLFRRVDYGLQGGLVLDYLHDDWVYQADLMQVRGELSYMLSPCQEAGFRFTDSQQTDNSVLQQAGMPATTIELTTLNNYLFFYRCRIGEEGRSVVEFRGGATEDSDALWGLSLAAPLQSQVGLQVDSTFSPASSSEAMPYSREAWNVSMALVWTPGRHFGRSRDYYRPLFQVADAGSMLVRRILP